MAIEAKSRRDVLVVNGLFRTIWSLQIPGVHPVWDEYLVCLYDLAGRDPEVPVVKHRPDVTHEFLVVPLAPEVRLNFDVDVFTQSTLVPLFPPNHGFQFVAESDEAATARVQVCVNSILQGSLSPDSDFGETWDMLWSDGVSLRRSVGAF